MYGSSLMWVTRSPRASISAPIEAAPSPLPIDETTPPVTKTNLVRLLMVAPQSFGGGARRARFGGRRSRWSPRALLGADPVPPIAAPRPGNRERLDTNLGTRRKPPWF